MVQNLKVRKDEVERLIASAEAQLKPLVVERDALVAKYDPTMRELGKKIKELTAKLKLYDLKMEYAALVRALKR